MDRIVVLEPQRHALSLWYAILDTIKHPSFWYFEQAVTGDMPVRSWARSWGIGQEQASREVRLGRSWLALKGAMHEVELKCHGRG